MTIILCLASFLAGLGVMALYSLTHGSQVQKLGADIMGEFQKLKEHLGVGRV